jgi:hypothetical protein
VYAVIAEGCAEGKGTHSTGKASELGGAGGGVQGGRLDGRDACALGP